MAAISSAADTEEKALRWLKGIGRRAFRCLNTTGNKNDRLLRPKVIVELGKGDAAMGGSLREFVREKRLKTFEPGKTPTEEDAISKIQDHLYVATGICYRGPAINER